MKKVSKVLRGSEIMSNFSETLCSYFGHNLAHRPLNSMIPICKEI